MSEKIFKEKEHLNKANKEKVSDNKSQQIKEELINIEFDDIFIDNLYLSQTITNEFGNQTSSLKGKTIDFFYSEKFERKEFINNNNLGSKDKIINYILNLRDQMSKALKIRKVIKGYSQLIANKDHVFDLETMKTLPRYQKMKRLEGMYNNLITIGLNLIQTYYWNDITKNETNIDLNLKQVIKKCIPIILNLKKQFEDQCNSELEYDADEVKLMYN